jgi:5-methylcytosine-specific restriction endonuclease McrA
VDDIEVRLGGGLVRIGLALSCSELRTQWMKGGEKERMSSETGICHVCDRPGADQVDHVVPLAEGGTDTEPNLLPIHSEPCHRRKTADEAVRARERRHGGGGS